MITSHLRLGMAIARKWHKPGFELDDLFGASQVGLLTAFEKYKNDRGTKFSTYAAWWIRATVMDHVLHNTSSMKTGTSTFQKFLFFNYSKLEKAARQEHPDCKDVQIEECVAHACMKRTKHAGADIGSVIEEIRDYKRSRFAERSLYAPVGSEGDSTIGDYIADESIEPNEDRISHEQEEMLGQAFLKAAEGKMRKRVGHFKTEKAFGRAQNA